MDRSAVRLDCLKICYRHDRPAAQAVDAAKILETYVLDETVKTAESPESPKGPGRPKKMIDKPATLS